MKTYDQNFLANCEKDPELAELLQTIRANHDNPDASGPESEDQNILDTIEEKTIRVPEWIDRYDVLRLSATIRNS